MGFINEPRTSCIVYQPLRIKQSKHPGSFLQTVLLNSIIIMEIFKKDDEYFGYGSLVCFAFLEPVVSWVLNCAVAVSKGFPQILHQHSNDAQSDTYKNSWRQADSLFFRNRKRWCFTQPICYSHGRSVIFKHGEVKTIVQVTLHWSWYNDVHKRRSMKGGCDWFKLFFFCYRLSWT